MSQDHQPPYMSLPSNLTTSLDGQRSSSRFADLRLEGIARSTASLIGYRSSPLPRLFTSQTARNSSPPTVRFHHPSKTRFFVRFIPDYPIPIHSPPPPRSDTISYQTCCILSPHLSSYNPPKPISFYILPYSSNPIELCEK